MILQEIENVSSFDDAVMPSEEWLADLRDSDDELQAVAEECGEDSGGWESPEIASFVSDVTSDIFSMYMNAIGNLDLLSAEEEREIGGRVQQGDEKARATLIERNLRLVVNQALRYRNRGVPVEDLVEEGNLGLMMAVERFDPTRGFRFSTYAIWWIRQAIERGLLNQNRTIRIPVHVWKKLRPLKKLLNQNIPMNVAVERLGLTMEDARDLIRQTDGVMSLDAPINGDPDLRLVDTLEDEDQSSAEHRLSTMQDEDFVHEILKILDERTRDMIRRRFGFGGAEDTLETLAQDYRISREAVRQIIDKGMLKIRRHVGLHHTTRFADELKMLARRINKQDFDRTKRG